MSVDYKVVSSEKKYSGRIFKIVEDKIILPNGKEAYREIVVKGNAAAVLPVIDNEVVLVRQYRHAAKRHPLEIPAGVVDDNENPYDCAVRELEEETGLKAEKLEFLTVMDSAIGFCTEKVYIYFAESAVQDCTNFDPEEFIETEKYSLDDAVKMVINGEIKDSKTITAILMYNEIKNSK